MTESTLSPATQELSQRTSLTILAKSLNLQAVLGRISLDFDSASPSLTYAARDDIGQTQLKSE